MPNKLLLFLSAESFHSYLWANKTLASEQHFVDTAEGREQFGQFLLTQPSTPTYLLTDFIEEDFRHETVPHLRGSERSGMLQRKFEQYYRNTPFRQALLLQRSNEGRRDEDVLFSALTNPAHFSPWLGILLANSIPLAGIYSVPNISAPLVKDINSDHLLLLSWEKHAGLRQTYFNHKRLHFSRLVSVNSSKPFGEVVATETARTEHYLDSLSLLPQGQVLDVVMVCHAKQRKEIENELKNTDAMHFSYLDIQTLGKKLNTTFDYVDSDATPLFLHLLATKPPASQYASAEHKHFFNLLNFRRNLLGLSAALMLGSLIWGITNLWWGDSLNSDNESTHAEIQQLTQQTQKIIQNFPNTPGFSKALATASDMKTAVLLVRKLDQYSPSPQVILADLSTTLNVFPNIQIDKLTWNFNAIVSANPNSPEHVILLKGVLQEWSGNYRDGLAYLEDFQQALFKHGHVVTPVSLPLDVSASGSIAINENINKSAQFELKIFWRPQPLRNKS
ncbi:MAG: hypothetical protein ABL865_03215 [Candidatus Nitrotoga sp.]